MSASSKIPPLQDNNERSPVLRWKIVEDCSEVYVNDQQIDETELDDKVNITSNEAGENIEEDSSDSTASLDLLSPDVISASFADLVINEDEPDVRKFNEENGFDHLLYVNETKSTVYETVDLRENDTEVTENYFETFDESKNSGTTRRKRKFTTCFTTRLTRSRRRPYVANAVPEAAKKRGRKPLYHKAYDIDVLLKKLRHLRKLSPSESKFVQTWIRNTIKDIRIETESILYGNEALPEKQQTEMVKVKTKKLLNYLLILYKDNPNKAKKMLIEEVLQAKEAVITQLNTILNILKERETCLVCSNEKKCQGTSYSQNQRQNLESSLHETYTGNENDKYEEISDMSDMEQQYDSSPLSQNMQTIEESMDTKSQEALSNGEIVNELLAAIDLTHSPVSAKPGCFRNSSFSSQCSNVKKNKKRVQFDFSSEDKTHSKKAGYSPVSSVYPESSINHKNVNFNCEEEPQIDIEESQATMDLGCPDNSVINETASISNINLCYQSSEDTYHTQTLESQTSVFPKSPEVLRIPQTQSKLLPQNPIIQNFNQHPATSLLPSNKGEYFNNETLTGHLSSSHVALSTNHGYQDCSQTTQAIVESLYLEDQESQNRERNLIIEAQSSHITSSNSSGASLISGSINQTFNCHSKNASNIASNCMETIVGHPISGQNDFDFELQGCSQSQILQSSFCGLKVPEIKTQDSNCSSLLSQSSSVFLSKSPPEYEITPKRAKHSLVTDENRLKSITYSIQPSKSSQSVATSQKAFNKNTKKYRQSLINNQSANSYTKALLNSSMESSKNLSDFTFNDSSADIKSIRAPVSDTETQKTHTSTIKDSRKKNSSSIGIHDGLSRPQHIESDLEEIIFQIPGIQMNNQQAENQRTKIISTKQSNEYAKNTMSKSSVTEYNTPGYTKNNSVSQKELHFQESNDVQTTLSAWSQDTLPSQSISQFEKLLQMHHSENRYSQSSVDEIQSIIESQTISDFFKSPSFSSQKPQSQIFDSEYVENKMQPNKTIEDTETHSCFTQEMMSTCPSSVPRKPYAIQNDFTFTHLFMQGHQVPPLERNLEYEKASTNTFPNQQNKSQEKTKNNPTIQRQETRESNSSNNYHQLKITNFTSDQPCSALKDTSTKMSKHPNSISSESNEQMKKSNPIVTPKLPWQLGVTLPDSELPAVPSLPCPLLNYSAKFRLRIPKFP